MFTVRRTFVVALLIAVAAAVASAQSPTQPRFDSASLGGFHVVLLLAKNVSGTVPNDLPTGVAKALREAAELLPFKSYQVQDQTVLRSNGSAFQRIHLLGPLSRDYELFLETKLREPQRVSVSVNLTYKSPDVRGSADVLATEFSARLGETVVVGTSKVKSDESLVLLITPLAGALATAAPAQAPTALPPLRISVFTAVAAPGEPIPPDQKARQDSVTDLKTSLANHRKVVVKARSLEQAELTLEVLGREVSDGKPVMLDPKHGGEFMVDAPFAVPTRSAYVFVRLRVVGRDTTANIVGGGPAWTYAADDVWTCVEKWVNQHSDTLMQQGQKK
jgi:hypothetical protein